MILEYMNNRIEPKGTVKRKAVIDRSSLGLFSVIQMKLTDAYFHTSVGYVNVDPVVSVISIETYRGKMDIIAGIKMQDSASLIKRIIREKIAIENIPAYIEDNCKLDDINKVVEDRAIYLYSKLNNKPIITKVEEKKEITDIDKVKEMIRKLIKEEIAVTLEDLEEKQLILNKR